MLITWMEYSKMSFCFSIHIFSGEFHNSVGPQLFEDPDFMAGGEGRVGGACFSPA